MRCNKPARDLGDYRLHPDKCACVHPLPSVDGKPLPGIPTPAQEYAAIIRHTVRELREGKS